MNDTKRNEYGAWTSLLDTFEQAVAYNEATKGLNSTEKVAAREALERYISDSTTRITAIEAELALVDGRLWECPECMFSFDASHTDGDGTYSCPVCAEGKLIGELSACRRAIPDTPDFDFLAGKTLTECVEALVAGVPYAIQLREAVEQVRFGVEMFIDHAQTEGTEREGLIYFPRSELDAFRAGVEMLDAALAKSEGAARTDNPKRAQEVHSATSTPAGDDKALGDRASPVPDLIQDEPRTVSLQDNPNHERK